jgi:hypothetical protein
MLAMDDNSTPSLPEGSRTFRMATWNCRWEEGTIGASGCRLGADEGRIGGADGDKTRRQQTPQNRLRVYYHVLEGSERASRGCRARVEGKRPEIWGRIGAI